jgi:integrase
MRKSLTDKGVAALKPRVQRYAFPDPELTGHYVRVQPTGAKSFAAVARAHGRQIWTTIGAADAMSIADARDQARAILKRVRSGLPAVEVRGETVNAVVDTWLKRHAEPKGLRTLPEIRRLLNVHVRPAWGNREFATLRRSDIAALLDEIEDNHGVRVADIVLGVIRSIATWYATRHDDYQPPIVRGMRRQSAQAMARSRMLSDDELRAVWKAAEASGPFGGLVRLCLLTAQRRAKVINMRWDELTGSEWSIPREPREKGNAGVLVLPNAALMIIEAQPPFASNPHVFAGRFDGPIVGLTKFKTKLDQVSGVTGWRLHDLRRTARSLMARAGVRPEVAERVMGHAIAGVEGVYDRHSYLAEKADALQRLAAVIDGIVNPRENVIPMARPSSQQ